MSKATEDALATLHGTVAVALTDALVTRVVAATEDAPEQTIVPSAAHIMAAITFLKNNNITADASSNQELTDLSKALADRRTANKARMNKRTIEDVAEQMERELGGHLQ